MDSPEITLERRPAALPSAPPYLRTPPAFATLTPPSSRLPSSASLSPVGSAPPPPSGPWPASPPATRDAPSRQCSRPSPPLLPPPAWPGWSWQYAFVNQPFERPNVGSRCCPTPRSSATAAEIAGSLTHAAPARLSSSRSERSRPSARPTWPHAHRLVQSQQPLRPFPLVAERPQQEHGIVRHLGFVELPSTATNGRSGCAAAATGACSACVPSGRTTEPGAPSRRTNSRRRWRRHGQRGRPLGKGGRKRHSSSRVRTGSGHFP